MDTNFHINFQNNYNRVVNFFGNAYNQNFFMSLASKYTLENREFSGVALQKVVDRMVENSNKAIQRNSPVTYHIAVQFLGQNIDGCMENLSQRDMALKEAGFTKSPFRLAGAMMLEEDILLHAKRAKTLYDEMHRKQYFLTSKEDIPYVVLLSKGMEQPHTQVDTILQYYQSLRKQGFMLGNSLQCLAQILTMYSSEYNEMLLQYVAELKRGLNQKGIKIKPIHYPYIGILALNATDNEKIDEIAELHKSLLELKIFRMAKELALIVSIQKIISELVEVQNMVNMKDHAFLENLIHVLGITLDVLDFALIPGSAGDFFNVFSS